MAKLQNVKNKQSFLKGLMPTVSAIIALPHSAIGNILMSLGAVIQKRSRSGVRNRELIRLTLLFLMLQQVKAYLLF